MKPKNIKEAKELAKRYETITVKEIKGKWDSDNPEKELTGFGDPETCTLCIKVKDDCLRCIYGQFLSCIEDDNQETYYGVREANTPTKLKNAYRARAKHIRNILKQWD